MARIRRILVAVKDPEAHSSPSIAKATQLARGLDAEVELFHALDKPIYVDVLSLQGSSVKQFEDDTRNTCLEQLEHLAAPLRRRGVRVTTAVEWDFPNYEAILRRASRIHADLIVAECHAHRHRAPGLLRLADWELLRTSPLPVLLVKTDRPYVRPIVLAAIDPTHAFSKPARLDDEILRLASTVNDALGGKLHAMHAYSPIPPDMMMLPPETATLANVAAEIQDKAAAKAKAGFDRALRNVNIPANRRHLVGAHPIDAIEEVARDLQPAIVVMGAISRSGIKRLVIGNTAERVLDHLDADVLVVKPRGFASRVPRARRGARLSVAMTTTL